ncbi:hypothetical protein REPUB_Repub11eG0101400 [Reevesia pubescens]
MDKFHFLPIFALLFNLAFAGSHAALPMENYWKSVFPNTPMPMSLQSLLKPAGRYEILKVRIRASFLPRPVAESIPFSSQKFPNILNYFSLEAKSAEANLIKETIQNCEIPAIKGEERYCATSLESLIDWSVSELGKNIQVMSNEVQKETQNQDFTIDQGMKKIGDKEIVCHKMKYAYAVFLCHSIEKTSVYSVSLIGADGTKAKLLATFHKDTSTWSPDHLAFQILKVKPGTVPICHFLTKETLVWVPN